MTASATMPAANAAAPVKKNSNFQAIVKRLFQNRGAVIGLIIFIVLALAAAFTFGDLLFFVFQFLLLLADC